MIRASAIMSLLPIAPSIPPRSPIALNSIAVDSILASDVILPQTVRLVAASYRRRDKNCRRKTAGEIAPAVSGFPSSLFIL